MTVDLLAVAVGSALVTLGGRLAVGALFAAQGWWAAVSASASGPTFSDNHRHARSRR